MFNRRVVSFLILNITSVIVFGYLYYIFKKEDANGNVLSLGEEMWFSLLTQTTIGYSLDVPYNKMNRSIKIINISQLLSIFIITAIVMGIEDTIAVPMPMPL